MEYNQLLLLQLVIAEFESDPHFKALTDEADRLILDDVAPLPPPDVSNLMDDAISPLPPNLPDKLALLAAMEPTSSCKGCGTPNPSKDEGNNCEICGYPGLI